LIPTRQVQGINICWSAADSSYKQYRIRVFPEAIGFSSDGAIVNGGAGLFLPHEAVPQTPFSDIRALTVRLDWWMTEGWPDYVAQSRPRQALAQSVCFAPNPSLKQLVDGPNEYNANDQAEIVGVYYADANTMVEYLIKTYGSAKYWELL